MLCRVARLQFPCAGAHVQRTHVEGAAECAREIGRALKTESVRDFGDLKMRETD